MWMVAEITLNKLVEDSRQGMVLQRFCWAGANNPSPIKNSLLQNATHGLGVGRFLDFSLSDNKLLRRIHRHERRQVAGGWRRPHNEEPHNFALHQILLAVQHQRG
jgi:hypothetical protein